MIQRLSSCKSLCVCVSTVYVSAAWIELWRLIADGVCCSPGLRSRLPRAVASVTSHMMSSTCPFPPSSPTVTTADDKRSQIYFLFCLNQSSLHAQCINAVWWMNYNNCCVFLRFLMCCSQQSICHQKQLSRGKAASSRPGNIPNPF